MIRVAPRSTLFPYTTLFRSIGKGRHELASGRVCLDAYAARGGQTAEERLPNLLVDMQAIVDGQSQTDPRFESSRLDRKSTRLNSSHSSISYAVFCLKKKLGT